MMRRLLLTLIIPVLLLALAGDAAEPRADLMAVDSAFVQGDYQQSEILALRALQDRALARDTRARLYLTAGYAAIMLGREADGRNYFASALEAVPNLELDPVQVSPRFRMIFDDVKAARVQPPAEPTMIAPRPTRTALLTNLVLPGSGQWQEGRPLRGLLFLSAQAATAGVLVWQIAEARDSRAEYLAETETARIAAAYDRYNNDYRAAWGAGIAAAVVYVAAQADLIWMKPPLTARLAVMPRVDGVTLAYRW